MDTVYSNGFNDNYDTGILEVGNGVLEPLNPRKAPAMDGKGVANPLTHEVEYQQQLAGYVTLTREQQREKAFAGLEPLKGMDADLEKFVGTSPFPTPAKASLRGMDTELLWTELMYRQDELKAALYEIAIRRLGKDTAQWAGNNVAYINQSQMEAVLLMGGERIAL